MVFGIGRSSKSAIKGDYDADESHRITNERQFNGEQIGAAYKFTRPASKTKKAAEYTYTFSPDLRTATLHKTKNGVTTSKPVKKDLDKMLNKKEIKYLKKNNSSLAHQISSARTNLEVPTYDTVERSDADIAAARTTGDLHEDHLNEYRNTITPIF